MYRYKNKTVQEYRKQWYLTKSAEYHMYNKAKTRAKKFGIPFTIEIEDIEIPNYCPYLGIPLIRGVGKVVDNSPSLDRIKPKLGYIKGNVEVISFRANTMKSDASPELLISFAEKILERFNVSPTFG